MRSHSYRTLTGARLRLISVTESIPLTITRLRREIQDALWDSDAERAAALSRELARLEMLQSYGETWDHDY
jgi:hypothetical protein